MFSHGNPYSGDEPRDILSTVETVGADERGEFSYSNFGMSVLGQALAAHADTSYPQLVQRHVLGPVGLEDTRVLTPGEQPPAGHARGHTSSGDRAADWRGWGYAPAGIGAWSTAPDLARLLASGTDSSAPGSAATRPRYDTGEGDEKVGLGWFVTRHGERTVTWHNGGTGGFSAYIGFDRETRRGVVVLGNTNRSVDAVGLRLLGATPSGGAGGRSLFRMVILGFLCLYGLALLDLASRQRVSWRGGVPDRLALAATAASTVAVLVAARQFGGWYGLWLHLPPAVWLTGVALTAAGAYVAALRWRRLPATRGARWRRWVSTSTSVAIAVAMLAVMVV